MVVTPRKAINAFPIHRLRRLLGMRSLSHSTIVCWEGVIARRHSGQDGMSSAALPEIE
jgi:hypothetical protein